MEKGKEKEKEEREEKEKQEKTKQKRREKIDGNSGRIEKTKGKLEYVTVVIWVELNYLDMKNCL